jgi:hypothetical protein
MPFDNSLQEFRYLSTRAARYISQVSSYGLIYPLKEVNQFGSKKADYGLFNTFYLLVGPPIAFDKLLMCVF